MIETDEELQLRTVAARLKHSAERTRITLTNEKEAQAELAQRFAEDGLSLLREFRLSSRDICDFFANGIAVEVKLKARKKSIFRQLERYASHEEVKGLLLVSATSMGLPATIAGKPVYMASLSTAWL